jgi:hypothetical protein
MCEIIYEHIMTNYALLSQTLHMATQIDMQKYSERKFARARRHILDIHLICILSNHICNAMLRYRFAKRRTKTKKFLSIKFQIKPVACWPAECSV